MGKRFGLTRVISMLLVIALLIGAVPVQALSGGEDMSDSSLRERLESILGGITANHGIEWTPEDGLAPVQTVEIADVTALAAVLEEWGNFSFSELPEGLQNGILDYFHIPTLTMLEWEEAGMTLWRAVSLCYIMKLCGLTNEEVLTVHGAYEDVYGVLEPLNELGEYSRETRLAGSQYLELKNAVLSGESFADAVAEADSAPSEQTTSATDEPAQPELSYVAPYSLRTGQNETVSPNTGSLSLTYPLVSVPGINGMNMDLAVSYNSADAALYKPSYGYNYDVTYTARKMMVAYKNIVAGEAYEFYGRMPSYDKYLGEITGTTETSLWNKILAFLSGEPEPFPYYENENVPQFFSDVGFTRLRYVNTVTGKEKWVPSEADDPRPTRIYHDDGTYSGWLEFARGEKIASVPSGPNEVCETWVALYEGTLWAIIPICYWGFLVPSIGTYLNGDIIRIIDNSYSYATTTSPTYLERIGDIGAGWSWNLPSYDTSDMVLHLGGGAAYALNGNLAFKDHTLQDMTFTQNTGFSNGTQTSSYRLLYVDGTEVWFGSDGRCLGENDRFGNTVKYQYTAGPNGYRLSKIIDTAGRETLIAYTDTAVTITSPDGKATVLTLGKYSGRNILKSIVKPAEGSTTFDYAYGTAPFYLVGNNNNTNANLVTVTHPTGGLTKYSYTPVTEGMGQPYWYTTFKVAERKENVGGVDSNKTSYQYNGTFTGYLDYYTQASLPDSYTYSSTTTNMDGVVTKYTFNNKGLLINEESRDKTGKLLASKESAYNPDKLPTRVTSRVYGPDGVSFTGAVSLAEYDGRGSVTASWSPLAAGNTADTEHKTAYDYGTLAENPYRLPLTKTYKLNAQTTITEQNTLTGDKKSVAFAEVYENNILKQKTEYLYNSSGQVTAQRRYKDGFSDYVESVYGYDSCGNLTSVYTSGTADAEENPVTTPGFDPGRVGTEYTYDIMGRMLTSRDANGYATQYEYDGAGNVTLVTHPDGNTIEYERDYAANTLTVTNELGAVTRYEYNPFGYETAVVDVTAGITLSQKTYDGMFRLKSETGGPGMATVEYGYDALGRVTSKESHGGGLLLSRELYAYDDGNPLGRKASKTVCGGGDTPDIVTVSYADVMGNVVRDGRVIGGGEQCATYEYDYIGRKVSEKSARAYDEEWAVDFTAKWEYNFAGQVLREYNALGQYAEYAYDMLGNRVSAADYRGVSEGYSTEYTYDVLGRLLTETVPLAESASSVTKYFYDPAGNVLYTEQSAGDGGWRVPAEYTYNSRGWVTAATTGGSTVSYTYDGAGNMLTMTDGNGNTTTYAYDHMGRVKTITDPLGQSERYTYYPDTSEGACRLDWGVTDRNGVYTYHEYDGVGRETAVYAGTNWTEKKYYITGQTAYLANSGEILVYQYDGAGRLLFEFDWELAGPNLELGDVWSVKEYAYNAGDLRVSFTLYSNANPVPRVTSYAYDELGRLTAVSEGGKTAVYTYDINGNRASLTSGPVRTEYAYNRANLVTRVRNVVDGADHSDFHYGYYLDGNQSWKHEYVSGDYTEYEYDGAGRLVVEHDTSGMYDMGRVSYVYDGAGNRKIKADDPGGTFGRSTEYYYDENNRMTSLSEMYMRLKYDSPSAQVMSLPGSAAAASAPEYYDPPEEASFVDRDNVYEYDNAGRQTSQYETLGFYAGESGYQTVDVTHRYDYDKYGRLTGYYKAQIDTYAMYVVTESFYSYRPDGLRHSKRVNFSTQFDSHFVNTVHIWDGANIAADVSSDTGTTFYVRGINLLWSVDNAGNATYYVYNAHGDVVATVGDTEETYRYDAFGQRIDWPENVNLRYYNYGGVYVNPFRYCGEYYDEELGYVYLRARYYEPATGRFVSEDPAKDGTNWYVYCGNNPILLIDPNGLANSAAQQTLVDDGGSPYFSSTWLEQFYKEIERDNEFWGGVGDVISSIGKAAFDSLVKFAETISAVGGGFRIEVGVGVGYGAGAIVTVDGVPIEVEGKAICDVVHIILCDEGLYIGSLVEKSISVGIEGTPINYQSSEYVFYNYVTGETTHEKSNGMGVGAGVSLYIFVGGSASITYDFNKFLNDLIAIWTK